MLAATVSTPAEISTFSVPVRTSIAPLVPLVEAQVPRTFADEQREFGVNVRYDVLRDAIALKMTPTGLQSSTVTRYWIEACPGPFRCVSCGIGEPRREAVITLQTEISWDESWRMRSKTTPQPASFPNQCTITSFDLDVTDRFIAPVVNRQLREAATTIDRNVPRLTSMRVVGEKIWSGLQAPFEIAPRTWLVFEPLEVALGPVRGAGLQAESTLTIRARTRVVVGNRPGNTLRPLPALRASESPGGLRVPFDIELPYAEASRLANEQFGQKSYRVDGGSLRIDSVRLLPARAGRVAVEAIIDYQGGRLKRYAGPVVLEGTPRIDAALRSVTVPDLDYSLEGRQKNLFVRTAEAFAHDAVRARLRESASFPLAAHIETARAEITRALNRQLASGVRLYGVAQAVVPQTVSAGADGVVVRVVITGSARVDVTQ